MPLLIFKLIVTFKLDKERLSDRAIQICKDLHINPDDMIDK